MPFRKNVFILGAGFSAESGAPVVQNFFERAMELWKDPNSPLGQDEREIFKQVFDYRHELEIVESRIKINLDNIEDLFGTVEMASQLGIGDPQITRKNLVYVILRTLELTAGGRPRVCSVIYRMEGSSAYSNFDGDIYQFFVSVVARRWSAAPENGIALDSIISLNYDLLLEEAMKGTPIAPLYDLPPDRVIETQTNCPLVCRVRLLKLHGSANWSVCPSCKGKIYILGPPEASIAREGSVPGCQSCGQQASARLIVPPTWNKEEYRLLLNSVWQSAARELASAQRIFVIGYSMPETDKFFQYLLALSLSKNTLLDEVVVVNQSPPDSERIAKLFRQLYERDRVNRPGHSFSSWVSQQEFQRSLHQVFPRLEFSW